MSALARLTDHGQSFWLDSLSRQMLEDGTLAARIREQGLSGITSNPAIFAKAMADAPAYDARIRGALENAGGAEKLYTALAIEDVRDACDLLLPTYREKDGTDGFVSLEVSPHLAYDPVATMRQARSLWDAVARPNLLVKVPFTRPGLHAAELLVYDGVNINVTLLFGLDQYRETLHSYVRAMEKRRQAGRDLQSVASVASFFLSRIDVAVDRELRQRIHPSVEERIHREARALLGKAAVANAKLAYAAFREILASERWHLLQSQGARPQLDYATGEQVATRAAFGSALRELGAQRGDLVTLDGDVKNSTKTEDFSRTFPLDVETLQRAARETEALLVIEDHNRDGGLGEAVAAQVGRPRPPSAGCSTSRGERQTAFCNATGAHGAAPALQRIAQEALAITA